MRKHKHFKVKGYLNFWLEARNPCSSENMRKVDFHGTGKFMQFPKHRKNGFSQYGKSVRKNKYFKFMGFLNISGEAEIHMIPKTWEM